MSFARRDVTFADLAFVGLIAGAEQRAQRQGTRIVLRGATGEGQSGVSRRIGQPLLEERPDSDWD